MNTAAQLTDKRIVVSGGASGIGRACVLAGLDAGASVVAVDRDERGLTQLRDEVDTSRLATHVADLASEADVVESFERAVRVLGGVDGAVACAGIQLIGQDAAIGALETDVLDRTLAINVRGSVLFARSAVRAMTGGGSFVVIGSPTGARGKGRGFTAYSVSKAAVMGLANVMAVDCAEQGIRVNTVVPGFTRTPLVTDLLTDPAELAGQLAQIPMGRPGEAAEAANAVVFLLSDAASYVTGATVTVDGGMLVS